MGGRAHTGDGHQSSEEQSEHERMTGVEDVRLAGYAGLAALDDFRNWLVAAA
jgi:hypothetical protein